ncbi:MAG TPA: D-alanine--D-alanine ligase family protein [Thermomicrobiales bacterium]|nr:D-alanine--D-alanine ligase family protein [Thermomicrobiales bacterium]
MTGQQRSDDTNRKVRVAVIFGGQSGEHDVSLRSAQTVLGALDDDRFEAIPIGVTREGQWLTGADPMAQLTASSPLFALEGPAEPDAETLEIAVSSTSQNLPSGLGADIDVVFPVLHGPMGEDGTVQGLLELAGIPFVGSGVLGSALAMDKAMAKLVLQQHGIPQAPWLLINRRDWERDPGAVAGRIGDDLGYPCFVKPANMGSSVGVTKVHNPTELGAAIELAGRLDRRIVAEKGMHIRELEVSVLGNENPVASVVGEVISINEFYDYSAKYVEEGSQLVVPADIPAEVQREIQRIAVEAFVALDLAGLARADFFLDLDTGQVLLNEVNTMPGFTSISMYPRLWEASGVTLPDLVERLLQLALERSQQRKASAAHS